MRRRTRTFATVVATIVVASGASRPRAQVSALPDDFGIACVDASSGAERWRTPVTAGWPPRLRIAAGALWERHGDRGEWRRRDLSTGALRARAEPPPLDTAPDPAAAFWTTTDAILHDKDGVTGTVLTTAAFVDDLAVVPGRGGPLLVFALDRDDGQVYGFGLADARLRWVLRPRDRVDGFEAGDGSRVEVLGDRLLVHAPPALMAVDPRTGAPAWTARVPALEGRWGPLRAIDLGATWIVTVDGVVIALDAGDGTVRWVHDAGAGGATAPVAGDGTVCFDRRDDAVVPYGPDEAEIARALAITVEGGRVRALRWVRRAEVARDADRRPLVELPVLAADATGPRLELTTLDARHLASLAPLLAVDGTIVLEVPGAWEDARVVLDAAGADAIAAQNP